MKRCSAVNAGKVFYGGTRITDLDLSDIEACTQSCIEHPECEGFEYYPYGTCTLMKDDPAGMGYVSHGNAVGSAICQVEGIQFSVLFFLHQKCFIYMQ